MTPAIDASVAKLRAVLTARRRAEERGLLAFDEHRWRWRRRDGPLTLAAARARQQTFLERRGIVLAEDEDAVRLYRAHLASLCRRHGITVSYAALPATNAYARPGLREIEIAPVLGGPSYARGLHEVGHVMCPHVPAHGTRRPCVVGCEVGAWRWAMTAAVAWTMDMHAEMRTALASYAALETTTVEDRARVQAFSGSVALAREQLRRLGVDGRA